MAPLSQSWVSCPSVGSNGVPVRLHIPLVNNASCANVRSSTEEIRRPNVA